MSCSGGAQLEEARGGEVQVFDGLPLVEEALGLKEKANLCVKQKKFQEGVALYEQGLGSLDKCKGQPMLREELQQVDALRAVLHCNIAQCMLSLQLYRRAVEAASACLELDPANAKALHRRSKAHEALREHEEALKDALALRKQGCAGLERKELEDRCEKLLLTVQKQNQAVNQVAKQNEDMFKMKERFDAVFEKYHLEDADASPQVATWLVSDSDFPHTVDKMMKKWNMERRDAEDFAKWISKGLELKIIPRPQLGPEGCAK